MVMSKARKTSKARLNHLIKCGYVEECPRCGGYSAYAWGDCDAYGEFADGIIPGGFRPEPGTIAHIGTAFCFEWECGHCGAYCVPVDSPILADVYTHGDSDGD